MLAQFHATHPDDETTADAASLRDEYCHLHHLPTLPASAWQRLDQMPVPEMLDRLQLNATQQHYILALLALPEEADLPTLTSSIQALEADLMANKELTTAQKALPLGCMAIARNSAAYWDSYYDLAGRRDTVEKRDTVRMDKKGRPVPRTGLVMRADFYGLLKGALGGTIIWVLGDLPKVQLANAAAFGIAFAVAVPALESYVYNLRFRRGRTKDQEPDPLEQWELYQNGD